MLRVGNSHIMIFCTIQPGACHDARQAASTSSFASFSSSIEPEGMDVWGCRQMPRIPCWWFILCIVVSYVLYVYKFYKLNNWILYNYFHARVFTHKFNTCARTFWGLQDMPVVQHDSLSRSIESILECSWKGFWIGHGAYALLLHFAQAER